MSSRKLHSVLIVAVLAALLLAGCQAIRPLPAGAGGADALIEQRKAEALAQELNTFDLMIALDWGGYDAVTDPVKVIVATEHIAAGESITEAQAAGKIDQKVLRYADVPEGAEVRPNDEFGEFRWVDGEALETLKSPLNVRQFGHRALAARPVG